MKLFLPILTLLFFISCSDEEQEIPKEFRKLRVEIVIPDSAYTQLKAFRDTALKNGVIAKSQKKYVIGSFKYNGKKVPIKLRLKGDWVDHLKGDKWSFRIKVRGNNSFLGLKSFSIQSPHTRSFLHEWFMHKLYLKEGILSTRYEFIPVILNGKYLGIYALEEHFDKQLVEAKNRREGPILKFNEEGIWETRIGDPTSYHALPYFEAAEVIPFKKNRTLKNPTLKENFKTAQRLLLRHKAFDDNIEEIFDIDKMAKFYALTDIANTDHPLIWHNLRYYYNPVSRRLEPIAYDCYPEEVKMSITHPIYGFEDSESHFQNYAYIHYYLFNYKPFKALYVKYLKEYSAPSYLTTVFSELSNELATFERLISLEYPNTHFDKAFYFENAKAIQKILPEYIKTKQNYQLQRYSFEDLTNTKTYYYNTGLKAFSSPFQDTLTNIVQLYNYHSTPVKIIGYSLKRNKDSLVLLGAELTIQEESHKSEIYKITLPRRAKRIFFIAKNKPFDTLHIKISKWAFRLKQTPFIENMEPFNFKRNNNIIVNQRNKLLVLKKGDYTFSNDLILPKGWTFIIQKGVKIDLINQAAIISYSPVHADGSASNPIAIYSSDNTGQGLTIIDGYGNSLLKNVTFNNLTSLNKYGWHLTGAVTFYQSNVIIDSCVFENNNCEDAINLVCSNFSFSHSFVNSTFSDGFDADFCTGIISKSVFKKTGNDCIDLSGSKIEIENCIIENGGDKGISGGENSQITVKNTMISNAKIAIASKDYSTIKVTNVSIENVEYGYVVFRKKPEYGPATIIVNNEKQSNPTKKLLIDRFATFVFNGDTTIGTDSVDVDALYIQIK